jgi:class 3 adenylate cyclase
MVWTLAKFPPLDKPTSESGTGSLLSILAVLGIVAYATAAIRFWYIFRNRMSLLPAALIACFALLTEAMIGVAVTGERAWHASWWLWHILIITSYLLIGFAARRQWHDERFRPLYLETTREHLRQVSVLFTDLAGYTAFTERSSTYEVAKMLNALHGMATTLVWRRFGGAVESLTGDGMYVSFNTNGDQPDHALRAASAGLALQQEMEEMVAEHPKWPRMRVGVNTGGVVIREMGGDGYCVYQLVGDIVNTASRLEGKAEVGSVLIGAETYSRLPVGTEAKMRRGMQVKGKSIKIDAYELHSLPATDATKRSLHLVK